MSRVDDIKAELSEILADYVDSFGDSADEFLTQSSALVDELLTNHAHKPEFPLLSRSVAATISLMAARHYIEQKSELKIAMRGFVLGLIRGAVRVAL